MQTTTIVVGAENSNNLFHTLHYLTFLPHSY